MNQLVLSSDIKAKAVFSIGRDMTYYDIDPLELLSDPFKVIGDCINMTDKPQTIRFEKNGVEFSSVVKIASAANSDAKMRTYGAMVSLIGIIFGGKEQDELCDDYEPAQKLKAAYESQGVKITVCSWKGFLTAAKGMSLKKRSNLKNHALQIIEANRPLFDGCRKIVAHNKELTAKIKAWN
jgi:hypothetical protein